MSLITPSFGLFFWMTVVFLCVFVILWKFGFPVIVKMVNDRKKFIDDSLKSAHEAAERLANIQQESEQIVLKAREEQAAIIKDASQTRDAIVSEAQSKAKAESLRILDEAHKQIEAEKQAAIRDIRQQVAQLSVEIAEKVVRTNLHDDKTQMELVNRMLDEIEGNDK